MSYTRNPKRKNYSVYSEESVKTDLLKNPVFWTVLLAIISGTFALGHYFGKDRYNKDLIESTTLNNTLSNDNLILRTLNDSLKKLVPIIDPVSVIITNPKENNLIETPENVQVTGLIKNIPSDSHLWLVVHPENSSGWWPQISEIIPKSTGEWKGSVKLGGNSKGSRFEIHVVIANKQANPQFNADKSLNNSLPDGAKSLQFITVIKNK